MEKVQFPIMAFNTSGILQKIYFEWLKLEFFRIRLLRIDYCVHIVHNLRNLMCLRGEGCPHVPMVQRSQYIRIKNPLHKHFAGMPMVGG